ncbi:uncharacterized protein LOC108219195 [Daucus carota subsp. sativus]|uniref:uncharacterized protein LOC108219195 n=1 Tax=Daucus carota subsp. sativus TaxID=79200 RepID=UPI0007F00EFD|nr:PREDICTED: uncharacterized protein LOC108219195 [Daucus carota subsp. sativus]
MSNADHSKRHRKAKRMCALNRAKVLLEQDKIYDKGFKFDHVWEILKDSEKFGDDHSNATPYRQTQTSNFVSSQANSPATESPTSASPGLSSFSPDINDLSVDGSSSQRPIGVKKAKEKRKVEEHTSAIIDTIKEEQRQVIEILKKNSADRQQNYEIQMLRAQNEKRKLDMAPYLAENKILIKDLNSIDDPILREHFRNEQLKILQKRSTHDQAAPHGFHDDLPEY